MAIARSIISSACFVAVAAALAACGSDEIVSVSAQPNNSVNAEVGNEISISLQTIGAGAYSSPPAISSNSVTFLDVSGGGIVTPAGPTQTFRFRATSKGTAVVVFTHTGNNPAVKDTIVVR